MFLWFVLGALTLVVTAIVAYPLVRPRLVPRGIDDDLQRRLAVFRDRRDEIERDFDAGRLPHAEASAAAEDLVRQMAQELSPGELASAMEPTGGAGHARAPGSKSSAKASSPSARAPVQAEPVPRSRAATMAALAVALMLPLTALLVYRLVGAPELGIAQREGRLPKAASAAPHATFEQIKAEIERRLAIDPQDGEAWALLGDANRLAGRLTDAMPAYERAMTFMGPSARLYADMAETLALIAGGDFSGRPTELLERAVAINPNDQKSVALRGAAAFRAGDLPLARTMLARLLEWMPPADEETQQLREILQGIDRQLAGSGATAGAPPPASRPAEPSPATAATGLRGTVQLAPELIARAPPQSTLFVVARPAEGPRIPVAALRIPQAKLPYSFTLDASNAMDPSRPMSKAGDVVVEARLSLSGQAIRAPGDLISQPVRVKAGSGDELELIINELVP